jgi:hypothetical protein
MARASLTGIALAGLRGKLADMGGKLAGLAGKLAGLAGKLPGLAGKLPGLAGKLPGLAGKLPGLGPVTRSLVTPGWLAFGPVSLAGRNLAGRNLAGRNLAGVARWRHAGTRVAGTWRKLTGDAGRELTGDAGRELTGRAGVGRRLAWPGRSGLAEVAANGVGLAGVDEIARGGSALPKWLSRVDLRRVMNLGGATGSGLAR